MTRMRVAEAGPVDERDQAGLRSRDRIGVVLGVEATNVQAATAYAWRPTRAASRAWPCLQDAAGHPAPRAYSTSTGPPSIALDAAVTSATSGSSPRLLERERARVGPLPALRPPHAPRAKTASSPARSRDPERDRAHIGLHEHGDRARAGATGRCQVRTHTLSPVAGRESAHLRDRLRAADPQRRPP